MKSIRTLIVICALFAFAQPIFAQVEHRDAASNRSDAAAMSSPELDRPVVPSDAGAWAGSMLIIVIAMFVMAAMIGPIVRAEMPPEPVVTHDDHGHDSHGHDAHGH